MAPVVLQALGVWAVFLLPGMFEFCESDVAALAWCRGTLSALGAACDGSKQAPLSASHMAAAAVATMTLAVKLRVTKVAGGGSPCWKPFRLELLPQP